METGPPAFDKNWELRFVAGPTCEPNGNEENAVAAAHRLLSDGIHLVLARGEPVAVTVEVGTWPNFSGLTSQGVDQSVSYNEAENDDDKNTS